MEPTGIGQAMNWIGAIVATFGGTSVLVIALSKWIGGITAETLLARIGAQHEKELEEIKNRYTLHLEDKKAALERSNLLFQRYSEHQFNLYNDLWKSLCDLKQEGDDLWESAQPLKLKRFSIQLNKTKAAVRRSRLLIEDAHYEHLIRLISQFGDFEVGKSNLLQLRLQSMEDINAYAGDPTRIRDRIAMNRQIKEAYDHLLEDLSRSFKMQLRAVI